MLGVDPAPGQLAVALDELRGAARAGRLGGELVTVSRLCRTRAGAEALGGALSEELADAAAGWAESAAGHPELVLAPLLAKPSGARRELRERAARARVQQGPLIDALHCVPLAWSERSALATRVPLLVWEAGARGFSSRPLGRWAWSEPSAVEALILEPARGHLGERVLAARAFAVLAEGFSEDTAPALARRVLAAMLPLLDHADPAVWAPAARGLGRFAAGSSSAAMLVFRGTEAPRASRRRRNIAAMGSLPLALGAEEWLERQLDRIFDERARRDDPWQLAALAIATPHLARERPETWARICELALASPSIELAWSLAQGLQVLARDGGGRGWIANEERVASALRRQLVAMRPEASTEVARQLDAIVCLDRALGLEPSTRLCLDRFDARIRADLDHAPASEPVLPRLVFDEELAQLASDNIAIRGRASLALRSATRAHAMHLPELVLGLRALDADTDHMAARCRDRLAAEVCEYGVRATLVGALGDLVASYSTGVGQPRRGRIAAEALRTVASSRWLVEIAREAGDSARVRRDVQRFRKPLEDLFEACLAAEPAPGAPDDAITVPPVVAAWWALCAGSAGPLAAIERGPRAGSGRELEARIASLEAALRGGDAVDAAGWRMRVEAALAELGATDTVLADVFARLARTLEAVPAACEGEPDDAARQLAALRAAATAMLAVGESLDDALAARSGPFDDDPARPAGPLTMASGTSPELAEPWRQLVAPLRERVEHAAHQLERRAAAAAPFVAEPGARLGEFVLVSLLGRGAMGEVWRAARGRQPVALKLSRRDVPPQVRKQLAEILRAEAANMEPLACARVAILLGAGAVGDMPYLATSYVRGRTLDAHLIDDPAADPCGAHLPIVRRVVRDVCIGLTNLHCHGLVHRDLKPNNIMLRMRGTDAAPLRTITQDPEGEDVDEAVLIDFGIAHAFHLGGDRGATPGYAAPESVNEDLVGPEADVYALGATLFHVLVGQRLTGDRPPIPAMLWHRDVEPFEDPDVAAAATRLPAGIRDAIAGACRRDPRERMSIARFRRLVCMD